MGYDGAFDGRFLMGTDEAKAAINVEMGAPAPTMPDLEDGADGSPPAPN